jgi:hypothetical protein
MNISDPGEAGKDPLDDSINKLETFIDETEDQTHQDQVPLLTEGPEIESAMPDIPILDELVDSGAPQAPPAFATVDGAVTQHQLLDLIDNLEKRLTDVLETLVKSMKDEMIDTISEEVKTQLDSHRQRPDSRDQSTRYPVTEPDYSHLDGYRPYGE